MKKNISTNGFFLLCISIFLNIPLICAHSDTRLVDSFDDDQEEWMLLEGLDNTAMSNTRNVVPVKSILGLIEDAGGFALLDQDFYLRTNPFVERNILDLPLWEMHSCQEPEK